MLHELFKLSAHPLPVRAAPVDAVAGRALHVLALGLEDVGRYTLFYLFFCSFCESFVAFKAKGENISCVQFQRLYDLAYLDFGVITVQKDKLEFTAGCHAPFPDMSVSGNQDSVLVKSGRHHFRIVMTAEEERIIAHHAQPFSQLTNVIIDDEFGTLDRLTPSDDTPALVLVEQYHSRSSIPS